MTDAALRPLLGFGMLLMLAFFLIIALRQYKNVKSLFNYHLYGDDLRQSRFAGSLMATNASLSGAFVLILYYGFLYGPWSFFFVWAFWVITQGTSWWTIKRTDKVMEAYGGWENNRATLHQFIGIVFSSPRARRYSGALSLAAYVGLIAAEVVLATHILDYVFPSNQRIPLTTISVGSFMFITFVMLCILIYNVLSGFRGTVRTDFPQWIIVCVMILSLGVFIIAKWPVLWSQYTTTFNAPADGVVRAVLNPDGNGYVPYVSFLLSNIIFWGLWWPGAMDQWQRCAAARTRELSLHPIWGTIGAVPIFYFGTLSFVFLSAGVLLRVSQPNAVPTPDFLRLLVADVQSWAASSISPIAGLLFCAILLWGLICASMATIDGYVMTASHSVFVDIDHYNEGSTLVDLDAADTERRLLTLARGRTIIIPVLVVVFSLLFSLTTDVYALIYFSFSFMFALLPPLFVGLMGWAKPRAGRACERSLLYAGISNVIGYAVILVGLERALRANDINDTFWWYQFVYWWPAVVSLIGAVVLWLNWPNEEPVEDLHVD